MKTTLLSLALVTMALSAYAQDSIPNGNFELWNSTTIDNLINYPYTSNNNATSNNLPANVVKTNDAFHGQTAIQLTTIANGPNIGYFLNADPKQGNISEWTNGMPYAEKPTGIRGYYKYNVASADSGLVLIVFRKNSVKIGSYSIRVGGIKNTYTLFNVPFIPALSETPDSVVFGAVSSDFYKNENGVVGSVLKLDSISFTGVTNQPTAMNGDFESWNQIQTPYTIVGWNEQDKKASGVTKTTDAKMGQAALQLTTTLGNRNGIPSAQPGSVTTGYFDNNCNCQRGGKAFSNQKDTLAFWYKYSPVSNDNAEISLNFFKKGISIAWESKTLTASQNYQYVEKAFQIGNTPDTVILQIQSSLWTNSATTYVGSVLKIDNLYFKSQLHTQIIVPYENPDIRISPNNSTGKYWIQNFNSGILRFNVYNATGISVQPLSGALNEINIMNYPNGIYFVKIHTNEKTLIKKIIKF
jgi:hypothetical protein